MRRRGTIIDESTVRDEAGNEYRYEPEHDEATAETYEVAHASQLLPGTEVTFDLEGFEGSENRPAVEIKLAPPPPAEGLVRLQAVGLLADLTVPAGCRSLLDLLIRTYLASDERRRADRVQRFDPRSFDATTARDILALAGCPAVLRDVASRPAANGPGVVITATHSDGAPVEFEAPSFAQLIAMLGRQLARGMCGREVFIFDDHETLGDHAMVIALTYAQLAVVSELQLIP